MDTREAKEAGVEGLVLLAVSKAVADSLPRKRRRQLVARLLSIGADWDRDDNVTPLAAAPPAAPNDAALRIAARRLRHIAQMLAWSPTGED